MYSSVSARGKEIATLRALGFGPFSVLVSTMIESILLALAGGVIGGLVAYLVFNGFLVSTLSFASFSQVVFNLKIRQSAVVKGGTPRPAPQPAARRLHPLVPGRIHGRNVREEQAS